MSLEKLDLSQIKTLEDALEIIKLLLLENHRLRERIAKLEKNSSTSSKPPSSDITSAPEKRRQPGKRKAGGQKGHKGFFRQAVEPDFIVDLHITQCPDCENGILENEKSSQVKKHQQAELVDKPVAITQYQSFGRRCSCCNKVRYPELPSEVIANQLFGPKLLSLCGYMKSTMGVSITELEKFFKEVLHLPIARSTIQSALFRVSEALSPCHQELLEALPKQASLNIDETGWKENGKRHWVWLFCTQRLACFTIRDSRGTQVLKDILGDVFGGAITSDFYSAYVSFATAKQQFCLAHLIRDLKFLTTLPAQTDQAFGEKLLYYMRRIFKLWHTKSDIAEEAFKSKVARLENELRNYLFAQILSKGSDARRIQLRMVKHWDSLFRFLKQPDVFEPTNNAAERDLRLLVRLRRISQGSRAASGQLWIARAASVVLTCRKQRINPWEFIQLAVNSHFFQLKPPSLVSGG